MVLPRVEEYLTGMYATIIDKGVSNIYLYICAPPFERNGRRALLGVLFGVTTRVFLTDRVHPCIPTYIGNPTAGGGCAGDGRGKGGPQRRRGRGM